jgi:hypothetical protein
LDNSVAIGVFKGIESIFALKTTISSSIQNFFIMCPYGWSKVE